VFTSCCRCLRRVKSEMQWVALSWEVAGFIAIRMQEHVLHQDTFHRKSHTSHTPGRSQNFDRPLHFHNWKSILHHPRDTPFSFPLTKPQHYIKTISLYLEHLISNHLSSKNGFHKNVAAIS
jgi:hypothetical protein